MEKNQLHLFFLDELKKKVPNRSDLVNILVDLLFIEKEAVYRRLRGDVNFSFLEIALIANHFGISLDNTINNSFSPKSRPYQLKLNDYSNPTEMDYRMLEQYIGILRGAEKDPNSTMVDSTNILPMAIYTPYKYIRKFYMFKWLYQTGDSDSIKAYKDVEVLDRVEYFQLENLECLMKIKNTIYLLDPLLFQYMVNDFKYFLSINLMTDNDIALVKKDLEKLLDDLENMAIRGYFEKTGNRVQIYIASVNFDTSHWYLEINNYRINLIKVFVLNNIASLDDRSLMGLKRRIDSLLRSSTLISVSGERQRIDFFDKQRKLISTL